MTNALTIEQIRAAQANDLDATAAITAATESRVATLAVSAARRMGSMGHRLAEFVEEFTQVGRIAVWQAVPRFKGTSVDEFFAFTYSTVRDALRDAVREERNGAAGADKDAVQTFGAMLEKCDGDVYAAERLAQTEPPVGRRLSADRANAARLAWQGCESLDVPSPTLINSDRAYSPTTGGNNAYNWVDAIAGNLGVPGDLVTADDLNAQQRSERRAMVHETLDAMGAMQRDAIQYAFGIRGYAHFGHGDAGDNAGMANAMGCTKAQAQLALTKGLKSFAKRWVAAVRDDGHDAYADELEAAAAQRLTRGGRK